MVLPAPQRVASATSGRATTPVSAATSASRPLLAPAEALPVANGTASTSPRPNSADHASVSSPNTFAWLLPSLLGLTPVMMQQIADDLVRELRVRNHAALRALLDERYGPVKSVRKGPAGPPFKGSWLQSGFVRLLNLMFSAGYRSRASAKGAATAILTARASAAMASALSSRGTVTSRRPMRRASAGTARSTRR